MDNNKIIVIALIAIIAVLIIGLAVIMPGFGKEKSNITIESNDALNQGDSIEINLTAVNGTPIDNETVNVTIKNDTEIVEEQTVVTNEEGVAEVEVTEEPGNYTVECTFEGNDNFTEDTTTQEIEVEEAEDTTYSSTDDGDPGAFYSAQEGRVIYTGEIHDAPDGHRYKHLGYNEWEMID